MNGNSARAPHPTDNLADGRASPLVVGAGVRGERIVRQNIVRAVV